MAEVIVDTDDNQSDDVDKSIPDSKVDSNDDSKVDWADTLEECAVCLQSWLRPVRLPCAHIFCYLCAKGFTLNTGCCALCRSEVCIEYFLDPVVVKIHEETAKQESCEVTTAKKAGETTNNFQWFYKGRNGWWKYDERTSETLEEVFEMHEESCNVLVSGNLYVVDFRNMVQYRKDRPSQRRHVKRDTCDVESEGVGGLKEKPLDNICSHCGKTSDHQLVANTCLQCTVAVDETPKTKTVHVVDEDEVDANVCPPKKRRRKARKGK